MLQYNFFAFHKTQMRRIKQCICVERSSVLNWPTSTAQWQGCSARQLAKKTRLGIGMPCASEAADKAEASVWQRPTEADRFYQGYQTDDTTSPRSKYTIDCMASKDTMLIFLQPNGIAIGRSSTHFVSPVKMTHDRYVGFNASQNPASLKLFEPRKV